MVHVRIDKVSFNPTSKLVKESDDDIVDTHPNVKTGDGRDGIMESFDVTVGESFAMGKRKTFGTFATSPVERIIERSEDRILFMTRNSMYELKLVKEED